MLRDLLDDPSNFDMAKAFVMAGRRRGFRVETEEGMRQWTAVSNAEMAAPNGLRAPVHRKRDDRSKDKRRPRLAAPPPGRRTYWRTSLASACETYQSTSSCSMSRCAFSISAAAVTLAT